SYFPSAPARSCPTSPLFPYTTLFRSKGSTAPYKRIRRLEFAELPKTISGKIRRVELRAREDQLHPFSGEPVKGCSWSSRARSSTDRKSTRLNSRHVSNSDAVFCVQTK